MPFYCPWKQVSVLVRVLDCSMLRVENIIRAYNIVCGMLRPGYVPSVLLVASKMNMNNNNNLFCITKKTNDLICSSKKEVLFFHLTKKNDLFSSTKNMDSYRFNLKKKIYSKMKKNSFDTSTKEEDSSCQSSIKNYALFHIMKKKQHRIPVIDPAFDITIVYPRSTFHMMEWLKKNHLHCVQKKRLYSLCYYHPKFCALKMNTTNNNNFFHLTKKKNLFSPTKNIDSCRFHSNKKIYSNKKKKKKIDSFRVTMKNVLPR